MKNVVFLDIDGVLNSSKFYIARNAGEITFPAPPESEHPVFGYERYIQELDQKAIDLLRDFVERNDLDIVISSTWRFFGCTHPRGIEGYLQPLFSSYGWENPPIIGHTEMDLDPGKYGSPERMSVERGEEIHDWIMENEFSGKYVILDDDSDFFELQPLVRTSFEFGLTEDDIKKAEEILNS